MSGKAVISLTAPAWRTPSGSRWRSWSRSVRPRKARPTLMFLTKEAVRLAVTGVAVGTACEGCPPLPDLVERSPGRRRPVPGLPDLLQRQGPSTRTS